MGNNYTNRVNGNYGYTNEVNREYAADIVKEFIIGKPALAGCDFNFAAAADHVQQDLDIGFVIPAFCKIISIAVECLTAVVGVSHLQISVGNVSAGQQYILKTNCDALAAILNNGVLPADVWVTPVNIFLGGDPTDNTWNDITAGKWKLIITYDDFNNV